MLLNGYCGLLPRREACHSSDIKNKWSYTSAPLYAFNKAHGDNFNSLFILTAAAMTEKNVNDELPVMWKVQAVEDPRFQENVAYEGGKVVSPTPRPP